MIMCHAWKWKTREHGLKVSRVSEKKIYRRLVHVSVSKELLTRIIIILQTMSLDCRRFIMYKNLLKKLLKFLIDRYIGLKSLGKHLFSIKL